MEKHEIRTMIIEMCDKMRAALTDLTHQELEIARTALAEYSQKVETAAGSKKSEIFHLAI